MIRRWLTTVFLPPHPEPWLPGGMPLRRIISPLAGLSFGLVAGALLFPSDHGTLSLTGFMIRAGVLGGAVSLTLQLGLDRAMTYLPRSTRHSGVRPALRLLALMAAYTLCIFPLGWFSRVWLDLNLFEHPTHAMGVLLGGMVVAGTLASIYSLSERQVAEDRLALIAAEAKALSFQARFQPHTIFNALNTIAALIHEAPDEAEQATLGLARLMRAILNALETDHWTLYEEVGVLRDLLKIEALRFGERLTVDIDLPDIEGNRAIPPLLLLPLVENALKHGFRKKIGRCHLRVEVDGGGVTVADDGIGRRADAPDGTGLTLTRERIAPLGWTFQWLEVSAGAQARINWAQGDDVS